jgi:hypothetical protein
LRLMALLRQTLFENALRERLQDETIDSCVEDLMAHRLDPHSAVDALIEQSGLLRPETSKSVS